MRTDIPRHTVRVVYTEPEFQRRTPGAPEEYRFDYRDIPATTAGEAIAAAIHQFWHVASLSHVGWRRCIQSILVLDGTGRWTDRRASGPRHRS